MTWSTGASFFHPDYGLKAGRLADAVVAAGPLLVDAEGRFWVYADGVWRPDAGTLARRVVTLLGERYRPAHLRAVSDVLAGTLERFEVAPTPALINLQSGLLRWAGDPDPVLIDHHDAALSSVQLPVRWDPLATCPDFDAFMESALPEDDRRRAWQVLGYLMMSGNPLQRMFMLSGSGGNGKGVFLNVVRALLGEANYSAVALQDFSDNRFATAELYGKLANICGDIDATFIQNTARIKQLSGDDKMNAERKGEHPFKFLFWGKAIFSANAIPGAADSSRGWLRRWEVIQFPYEPTKPDPTLSDRCTTPDSLAGIAVKAVDALRDLMADGEFARGESSETAHAEFAERANRVIRWINDPDSNVRRAEGIFNKGTILLSAFRAWETHDSGNANNATSAQRFTELTKQAGLHHTVRRGQRGFVGLAVDDTVFVKDRDRPWRNFETRQAVAGSAPLDPDPEPATLL